MHTTHGPVGRWLASILVVAAASLALPPLASAGITVDGSLTDWGITVGTPGSGDGIGTSYGVPLSGTTTGKITVGGEDFYGKFGTSSINGVRTVGGFTYQYMIEDSKDRAGDDGILGPNQGGQNYDAEFLGVGVEGKFLKIAILTGQRPDNGVTKFAPGDIRIVTADGVYGIEVGGGVYSGTASAGQITEGMQGTTFLTNTSGTTIAYLNSDNAANHGSASDLNQLRPHREDQTAGSVWRNPNWRTDIVADQFPNVPGVGTIDVQMQFSGGAEGERLSHWTADSYLNYIYKWDANSQHAVIEISLYLGFFGTRDDPNLIQEISWSPVCGNDEVWLTGLNIVATPEPSSLALLATAGLVCGGGWWRRRRNGSCQAAKSAG